MQKIFDYERAKKMIVARLKRDMDFHTKGLFGQMGEKYDDFDENFPGGQLDLMIAWNFWDSWIMEKQHNFPGLCAKIQMEDWPKLAAHIIQKLETNTKITDPVVLVNFDFTVQPTLWEKIVEWFQKQLQKLFPKKDESSVL